jgi:DNA-binding response OmpR family regulator
VEVPKKVLIVEDDPAIAAALGRRLENLGYKVLRAGTAKRGIELADEADFMFLDMRLPDFSGEILLERLRNSGNYIPVIAMSAILTKDEAERHLSKFQIVDFMEKPFTLQEVAEKAGHAAEKVEQIRFIGQATEKIKGFIERQNGHR